MARKLNPILQTELRKCYTQLLECIVREQGDKTQVSVAMLKKLYPLTMTGKTHPYAYIENEIGVDKSLISYFPEFDAKAWNFREFGQRMGMAGFDQRERENMARFGLAGQEIDAKNNPYNMIPNIIGSIYQ